MHVYITVYWILGCVCGGGGVKMHQNPFPGYATDVEVCYFCCVAYTSASALSLMVDGYN